MSRLAEAIYEAWKSEDMTYCRADMAAASVAASVLSLAALSDSDVGQLRYLLARIKGTESAGTYLALERTISAVAALPSPSPLPEETP